MHNDPNIDFAPEQSCRAVHDFAPNILYRSAFLQRLKCTLLPCLPALNSSPNHNARQHERRTVRHSHFISRNLPQG